MIDCNEIWAQLPLPPWLAGAATPRGAAVWDGSFGSDTLPTGADSGTEAVGAAASFLSAFRQKVFRNPTNLNFTLWEVTLMTGR